MKVEIKEVKKERQDGFYKVMYYSTKTIAQYDDQRWYVTSISKHVDPGSIKVLDESPITFEEIEPKPEFEPIELSLTIESKKELQELWHLLSIKRMNEFIDNKPENHTGGIIWQKINEIMEERNVKP